MSLLFQESLVSIPSNALIHKVYLQEVLKNLGEILLSMNTGVNKAAVEQWGTLQTLREVVSRTFK